MARGNLNKSEELVTNTAESKHTYLGGPESASIEIPPFRSHFIKFSKTVSHEVNLTLQHSHLDVLLQSKFWSESDADSGPPRYEL